MNQELLLFLGKETTESWVKNALADQKTLLIDHAHCEKKAASTALNLMFRYVQHHDLLMALSKLAREELRHFEQVIQLMRKRDINYDHLSPSRYAEGMRKTCRHHEPYRLVDLLIVGAFIEARSCERFSKLIPHLDDELAHFYQSLLKSEARHFKTYLSMAQSFSPEPIGDRVDMIRKVENDLIVRPDQTFRFHSGPVEEPVRC